MATNTNAQRAAVLKAAAQAPGQPFVPTVQPKPPATIPAPTPAPPGSRGV
jgi:hypothetical protein